MRLTLVPWLAAGIMLREAASGIAEAIGAPTLLARLPRSTTAAPAQPERPGRQIALGQLLLQADATEARLVVGSEACFG